MVDKELSEDDVKAKYIDPSLKKAGWDEMRADKKGSFIH